MSKGSRQRVAVLALERAVAFDAATPWQVLRDRYDVGMCAVRPGTLATTAGFGLAVGAGLEALERADVVIVPGFEDVRDPVPEPALDALCAAHTRGARVVSICTGAFALAAAGLLDGRRATTHWQDAGLLAERHPAVTVDPGVLYVDEGSVMTSAGIAAGVDLCLHLLRSDHGPEAANAAARRMVVAPHRSGGQAQFVDLPVPAAGDGLAATRAWMVKRLREPLSVAAMARHAGYSERSFARRFRAETGAAPLAWLIGQRVLHAQRLLETTDLAVDEVAARSGLGTAASLRTHLRRALRTTPTAYRRHWAG